MRTESITAALAALGLLAAAGQALAQCTSIKPVTRSADAIGLVYERPISRRAVEQAIGAWRTCANYGRGFPAFQVVRGHRGAPERTLRIAYVPASSSRKCGSFQGSTITLYAYARDESGRRISCSDLAQNLAHELGHALGLDHAAEAAACSFDIMATIDNKNSRLRRVTAEECQAVGRRWLTAEEGERRGERTDRPAFLVLALESEGLHLSDRFDPVDFDVDGDGILETVSWTGSNRNDAFLWLDRDGDGQADGRELVGSGTPLPGGHLAERRPAGSGFAALRAYDQPGLGGDGDGVLSPRDGVWRQLRLWIDRDHDGRTHPGEVYGLEDWEIVEIGLDPEEIVAVDGSLNVHRRAGLFQADLSRDGGRRHDGWVTEVELDVIS